MEIKELHWRISRIKENFAIFTEIFLLKSFPFISVNSKKKKKKTGQARMEDLSKIDFSEKKRKFENGNYEALFTCPLCKDPVAYVFAYIHLKDCVTAYEILYVKKPFITSIQPNLNPNPSPTQNIQVTSSLPPPVSSSVSPHSIPSSLPQPQIIRLPRCALEGCTLTRQKAVFIKLK